METTTEKKSGWTAEQEARIAHFQETLGLDRGAAIRKMRTEDHAGPQAVVSAPELAEQQKKLDEGVNTKLTGKPKPAARAELLGNRVTVYKAARAPKAKVAKAPKAKRKAGDSAEAHLSPQKLTAINELVRKEIGKGRAVEGVFKSSLSDKYTKYIWYGIDNGTVLSVNPDTMTTRWLDENSRSVKLWQKAQRASVKREEKAAKKGEAK